MQTVLIPAWHANMAVGHALVDKQHISLMELIRSLVRMIGSPDDQAFLSAVADIVSQAERHCATEDQLLLQNGFEWAEQHQQEHEAGLDRLRSLQARLVARSITREAACAGLVDWFEAHLVDMDLPARDYFGRAREFQQALEAMDSDLTECVDD